MRKNKSIVYLNYSPYENSGHILDYLLENFEKVYLFSIAHHSLGRKDPANKLTTYINGKLIKEEYLKYMSVPEKFVVILLPVRSLLNALQIIKKIIDIKKEIGTIDIYFTVNAFTATIGRILKNFGVVKKTVFWVWDYYPPTFPTLSGRLMRIVYWQFDKYATFCDRVCYLNHRMADVRKEKGVISKNKKIIEVPIGMGEAIAIKKKSFSHIKLGFIGVLKKSQGIGMLLKSAPSLEKYFKKVTFEIIGSGPDEAEFKRQIPKSKNVKYNFYGYVTEKKFKDILYNATIGISPYSPEEGNVSKYTDPGKPKRYIEFNLPVITTNVIEISKEIEKEKAGLIVNYNDYEGLAKAVSKIVKNYNQYVRGTQKMHKRYFYKDIYKVMFEV